MAARGDGFGDLPEMEVHGVSVGMWHDQRGGNGPLGAGQRQRCRPIRNGCPSARGTGAAFGPDTGKPRAHA